MKNHSYSPSLCKNYARILLMCIINLLKKVKAYIRCQVSGICELQLDVYYQCYIYFYILNKTRNLIPDT